MNIVSLIIKNKFVTVPILTWFLAQSFKLVSTLVIYKELDWTRIFGTGGMPSSHVGYVVTLCALIGKNIGVESAAFGITLAFAFVVISDAAGVRQAAGKQAKLLNSLMNAHFSGDEFYVHLKELIGHKPLEVLVGAALGMTVGLVLG